MTLMCSPLCMQLGPADGIRSSINRSRSAPAATLRASASNYHAAAANAAAANAAATALYRQCSNVSTSSEYHSDDSPTLAAGAASATRLSTRVPAIRILCRRWDRGVAGQTSRAACRK